MTTPGEQQPETVGMTFRFDFTGTPEDIVRIQENLDRAIYDLGGIGLSSTVGVPELDPLQRMEAKIQRPLDWVLTGLASQRRSTAQSELMRQGLRSARDILVLGSKKLQQFSGIGLKTIDTIQHNLLQEGISIPFKETPEIEDIVALCDGPSQIPVQVVMTRGLSDLRFARDPRKNRVTLEDAIAGTEPFVELVGSHTIQARARDFVDDFWRLKGVWQ